MDIYNLGCAAYDPLVGTAYGYRPSLSAGIAYSVLFGLSMLVHIFQTIYTRAWFTFVFAVGALVELLGWAARAWSAECPYNVNAFLMQICTLIIAPTFYAAGLYVILGRIIQIAGRQTSPISPGTYLWIFCTVDVIALVLQAVGGGLAAVAFQATPEGNTKIGTNIMIAGIDFQLASVLVFSSLFFVVIRRVIAHSSIMDRNMKVLVAVTCWCIVLIIMRSIYRTIELAGGWSGYVITTQRFFLALDGAPMLVLVVSLNVFHPGSLINRIIAAKSGGSENEDTRQSKTGDMS